MRAGQSLKALALLMAVSAVCVGGLFGSTHALAIEQRAMEQPSFASLQATELMAVSVTSLNLAAASIESGIHQEVTSIVNISERTLPVSVSVEGIDGLSASVEPGLLGPGQTAVVRLDGPVPAGAAGSHTGILNLYGFNQYIHFAIPVSIEVPATLACRTVPPLDELAESVPSRVEVPAAVPADEAVLPEGCLETGAPEGDGAVAADDDPGAPVAVVDLSPPAAEAEADDPGTAPEMVADAPDVIPAESGTSDPSDGAEAVAPSTGTVLNETPTTEELESSDPGAPPSEAQSPPPAEAAGDEPAAGATAPIGESALPAPEIPETAPASTT